VPKNNRYRLKPHEIQVIKNLRKREVNRLIVGDIHLPYTHKDYLQHCVDTYNKYNCTEVSFTGDIIDSHFSSFHPTSTESQGAKYELDATIDQIKGWFEAFPHATVTLGNHDLIIARKAEDAGVDKRFVRNLNEVLKCKTWKFEEHFVHDNVLYTHGTGCSGKGIVKRVQNWGTSMVQGHIHTEAFIIYTASLKDLKWGFQAPCGINYKSFAFSYAKFHTAKPILGCGVVLDSGRLPIIEPMIIK
tara:strand:+ start:11547 stop:12281 length:735 start_codon:yes stop_codon:yes gene_type:complete